MYTRIIVPFDGGDFSARSIPVARQIALATHARLEIVAFALTASHSTDLTVALRHVAGQIDDVQVDWRVQRVENVVTAIAGELNTEPGALICMTSVGRSHSAPVLGSVAEGVLQETFGPLLLVGPQVKQDRFTTTGPMLVCSDGSDTADAILSIAAQWAITMPFEPWVVNVCQPDGTRLPADLAVDVGTDTVYARHIAQKLQRAVGRTVQYEVLHNTHPARAITDFADEKSASMIAMATHGAGGVRRVALGSVTMSVVHHAPCPVLVDRPPHLPTA